MDLPELAFGHRFSWVASSPPWLDSLIKTAYNRRSVSLAATAQQLADQPTMAAEEVKYLNRLLDSRRARLFIAKAMSRLPRATKTALGDSRRVAKPTSNNGNPSDNFRPSTPCPNCRQFGHWKRDCPLLPRLYVGPSGHTSSARTWTQTLIPMPALPPTAPSAPADLHH